VGKNPIVETKLVHVMLVFWSGYPMQEVKQCSVDLWMSLPGFWIFLRGFENFNNFQQPTKSIQVCVFEHPASDDSFFSYTWKISSTQAAHSSDSQSSMPSPVVVGIVLLVCIGAYSWWITPAQDEEKEAWQAAAQDDWQADLHVPYERSNRSSGNNDDHLMHIYRAQQQEEKAERESIRRRTGSVGGKDHDHGKHKHPTKESAEREIHRMKSVGKDGCERLNAYYNDGLDAWYVGNSHW
jgi:hypothetical protein